MFIAWPMHPASYQEAEVKCTKCDKIWGLPKVTNIVYKEGE